MKRILQYPNPKSFNGWSTLEEACDCDIVREKALNDAIKAKKEGEFKVKMQELFPFDSKDDQGIEYYFSTYKDHKGSEKLKSLAVKYCDDFDTKYKHKGIGLLITGKYGNGKTRIVKTILNSLKYWNTIIFIDYVDLFGRIAATWSKTSFETEDMLYKCLINCDLLAIDDIGIGEASAKKEEMLIRIINGRKGLKKPTLFTMNFEGEVGLKDRIKSRIKETCLSIVNDAEDFRPEILQLVLDS